jgi:hypothetical protein
MKFFISTLSIALLSFAACLYLPWFAIAGVAFIVGFAIPQKPILSFLSGFTALFLLWGVHCFLLSNANEHLLASKMSVLILKVANPIVLILVTAFLGATVAGFAALAGRLGKKVFA